MNAILTKGESCLKNVTTYGRKDRHRICTKTVFVQRLNIIDFNKSDSAKAFTINKQSFGEGDETIDNI